MCVTCPALHCYQGPEKWHGKHGNPHDDVDCGDGSEEDEPEPDKQEELLVDNVDGEDTHGVGHILASSGAKLGEGAHGEDWQCSCHGISATRINFYNIARVRV